jgi:predicted nucleic acid-binding protein
MSKIFWDTNLFIYLIEQTPQFYNKVSLLRYKMIKNNDLLVTSALTLGELLVKPIEENRFELAEKYRKLLTAGTILISFDEKVAENYAKIRAIYKTIKPPDAIQLACASIFGVNEFYTNDNRLSDLKIEGIDKIKSIQDL